MRIYILTICAVLSHNIASYANNIPGSLSIGQYYNISNDYPPREVWSTEPATMWTIQIYTKPNPPYLENRFGLRLWGMSFKSRVQIFPQERENNDIRNNLLLGVWLFDQFNISQRQNSKLFWDLSGGISYVQLTSTEDSEGLHDDISCGMYECWPGLRLGFQLGLYYQTHIADGYWLKLSPRYHIQPFNSKDNFPFVSGFLMDIGIHFESP